MKLEEVLPALRAGRKIQNDTIYYKGYFYVDEDSQKIIYCYSDGNKEVASFDYDDLFDDNWTIKCELCEGYKQIKVCSFFDTERMPFKLIDCPECK